MRCTALEGVPYTPTYTIPASTGPLPQWKCDESGATENLWLNLSTGFIGSGRPVSHFGVSNARLQASPWGCGACIPGLLPMPDLHLRPSPPHAQAPLPPPPPVQNWDGTGGNGAALRHYEATGRKYPLAVKLGTITPQGADVYSYAPEEDDMVLDPHLGRHLAHWGINMLQVAGGKGVV